MTNRERKITTIPAEAVDLDIPGELIGAIQHNVKPRTAYSQVWYSHMKSLRLFQVLKAALLNRSAN